MSHQSYKRIGLGMGWYRGGWKYRAPKGANKDTCLNMMMVIFQKNFMITAHEEGYDDGDHVNRNHHNWYGFHSFMVDLTCVWKPWLSPGRKS